jgi:abortive infection bacteriophage resistance protein
LASWLHTLTFIRNCCAHHSRLWNRELSIRLGIERQSQVAIRCWACIKFQCWQNSQ